MEHAMLLFLYNKELIRELAGVEEARAATDACDVPPLHRQLFTSLELVRLALNFNLVPELCHLGGPGKSLNEMRQEEEELALACYDYDDPSDLDAEVSVEQVRLQEDLMILLGRLAVHNVEVGLRAIGPIVWWAAYGRPTVESLFSHDAMNNHEQYVIDMLLEDVHLLLFDFDSEYLGADEARRLRDEIAQT